MKRYFFSSAAVIVTAILFAFTTSKNTGRPYTNSFFEFDYAHYNPTLTNVQDESKWIKVSDIGTCNSNMIKACRIEVAPAYVSGNSLLSTANLGAAESSTDIAYVVSGNTIQVRNKN